MLGIAEHSATHDRSYRVELTGMVIHRYVKPNGHSLVIYVYVTPADADSNWFFSGAVDTDPNRSLLANALYALSLRRVTARVFDEDEDVISKVAIEQAPRRAPTTGLS